MSTKLRKCLSLVLVTMLLASFSISGAFTASADNQTGDGLAAYAMNAYNEGWQYVWGGASYGYVDCSGLIYSYGVGGGRTDSQMLAASPESGYVADGVPDIPGLGLWQPGHVGVYVGGGMAVDARDEISNVCYSSVASKDWVMWFKIAGVTYSDNSTVANDTSSTDTSTDKTNEEEKEDISSVILQKGEQGTEVNALQERLKELGFFDDDTTEYFGNYTESCLIEFQKAAGLDATGIYDKDTQSVLMSDDAPSIKREDSEIASESDTDYESSYDASSEVKEDTDLTEDIMNVTDSEPEVVSESDTEETDELSDTDSDSLFADFEELTSSDEEILSDDEKSEDIISDTDSAVSGIFFAAGDEGKEVEAIQQKLAEMGYYYGEINGVYDDATAYSVSVFQYDNGLDVTYIVNERTWNSMFGKGFVLSDTDSNSDSDVYGAYLKSGDNSDAVTDLQDMLIELRYLSAESNGQYDSATVEAVKLFQEVNGYPATDYITLEQFNLLTSGSAEKSPYYSGLRLGYKGDDVEYLQYALISWNYLDNESVAQLGIFDEPTQAAVMNAQKDMNVEQNGVADEQFVTMLNALAENKQNEQTSAAVVSAANATSSALSNAQTTVAVPQTGSEPFISRTLTIAVIVVSLLIALFFITVHYWNVSMEKRRRRTRRAATVSVYRRKYM